ncbi:hypothetical protein JYK21_04485 [Ralstonia pickettii]|nr:hypothetical protein [Ralstonia pickettii]
MGSLSTSVLLYIIFCLLALVTGAVYWVRGKFQVGAVFSIIFSLLAPLMTVLVGVQREGKIGFYGYIIEEMRAGNTWARLIVIIHIFLIAWVLFLVTHFSIKLSKSPAVREKVQRIFSKKEISETKLGKGGK